MKRTLMLAGLVLALGQTTGCIMTPRAASGLARAALWTAVVAANVAIIASHDAHYHSYYCGHHHSYRDGRYVYYYQDRWEYYEGGSWYYYTD